MGATTLVASAILATLAVPLASGSPPQRPAKGKLLVAARDLGDPNFRESVVLLVAHDSDKGSMGVIVNQPTPIALASILPEFRSLAARRDRLWRGGPVLPTSMLVLLRSKVEVEDSEEVFGDVRMLTTREAVERVLGKSKSRPAFRAYAGHAGWAPGQLDAEIVRGDWVVLPAKPEVVFSDSPEEVWSRLLERGEGQWTMLRAARAG